jgi:cytoskeletal protein RodZ
MSVSGILSSGLYNYGAQSIQQRGQQMKQEFQQLGQDLQSRNLSAAQHDFASLQQSQSGSTTSSTSNNPVAQDFTQLATDLKSGNTSAAQQDYAKIQQDLQSQAAPAHGHHVNHHHNAGTVAGNDITETMDDLGQELQLGHISSAQQAYSSLEQEFQMFAQSNPQLSSAATATAGDARGLSVSA